MLYVTVHMLRLYVGRGDPELPTFGCDRKTAKARSQALESLSS